MADHETINEPLGPWEQRVIALESAVQAKTDEVTALTAQLEAMQAHLDAANTREAERKAAEATAYVDSVRQAGVDAQSPVPEQDLAAIVAAFERDDADTAMRLGSAFVSRSQALGASGAGSSETKTINLGAGSADGWGDQEQADFYSRYPHLKQYSKEA